MIHFLCGSESFNKGSSTNTTSGDNTLSLNDKLPSEATDNFLWISSLMTGPLFHRVSIACK